MTLLEDKNVKKDLKITFQQVHWVSKNIPPGCARCDIFDGLSSRTTPHTLSYTGQKIIPHLYLKVDLDQV